ncbi:MAG TPA: GxxExxY protein [Flavobacteriales bacterium]|jgi:GxxExxY protein|nr:GxxExxY protein [Flavobacteriales bacterium]
MTYRELSGTIIGCAIEVHRELGPGLLESVYEHCLAKELSAAGINFLRQHPIPLRYKGEKLDVEFRLDLWVEQMIIVEIKAVDLLHERHRAQVLGYLKLTDMRLGLLINFNEATLTAGVHRVANGLQEP